MANTRTLTRPASLTEWLAREQARASLYAESAQHGLTYQPQASDLFIAPFAKCGATWLQQIVHGLRTHGDMNFVDLMQGIPWLEMAHYAGIDLNTPNLAVFGRLRAISVGPKFPKAGATSSPSATRKMPWLRTTAL